MREHIDFEEQRIQRTIEIYYERPGKPSQVYTEGLVAENERLLRTFKRLSNEISTRLLKSFRISIPHLELRPISAVSKTFFFHDTFTILQWWEASGELIGTYSDIAAPLEIRQGKLTLVDWFLDLWVTPQGQSFVLDQDEFEQAAKQGLIPEEIVGQAENTLHRLLGEIQRGIFPNNYLP